MASNTVRVVGVVFCLALVALFSTCQASLAWDGKSAYSEDVGFLETVNDNRSLQQKISTSTSGPLLTVTSPFTATASKSAHTTHAPTENVDSIAVLLSVVQLHFKRRETK